MRDSSGDDRNRARTLLVAGTASHVGKSTVAAGLCRLLADRGVAVAPFKAQNMSNNARVVVRPGATVSDRCRERGDEWGEIGVSQFVQARAAGVTPTTDCNPVLLKPRGDGESQLVIDGRAVGHVAAGEYYVDGWHRAREAAAAAHDRLAREHDVIVAEGAGSIAEINLRERDLANLETARFADAEILLLVDIERGGAFASLYGTIELLPADVRERVVGAAVTKFRGDASLLEPGIAEIESLTGVPVLGVLPHDDPGLPAEDSVSLPAPGEFGMLGDDDGVPADRCVRIAVPRLPRLSNATDLEALAAEPGVRVEFVPVSAEGPPSSPLGTDPRAALERSHAVVIPGTKNTVDDLLALWDSGLGAAIRDFEGPVVGLCGGYQILGERLTDANREGTGDDETVAGLGLLPVETHFSAEKRLERTTVDVEGTGPIAGASGTATGYEIHAGRTTHLEPVDRPLESASTATEDVLGTYLHGLFDNRSVREAFLETVARRAGVDRPTAGRSAGGEDGDRTATTDSSAGTTPYDLAARLVRDHVDLAALDLPAH